MSFTKNKLLNMGNQLIKESLLKKIHIIDFVKQKKKKEKKEK